MSKKQKRFVFTIFIVTFILGVIIAVSYYVKRLPFTSDGEAVIVKLERYPCFGLCPVYTVTVYGNGLVVYDGESFVETKGKRIKLLNEEEISAILAEFEKANFFSLADNYTLPATDLPETIIQIDIDGQSKRIRRYGGGCGSEIDVAPPELCELEKRLGEIVHVGNWVGTNKR